MNWNNLTVNASIDTGQVLTPISGLTVTFALCDTVNSLYYYYDMVTDSNGNATLPASNTLVSQQVELKVQTQAERENGGRYEDTDAEREGIYGDRTNYNTTQIDSTIVNSVSTWYVGAVYNGYKIYSDTYPLTTTTGELRFKEASGGGQETKSGSFKIKVANSNNVLCNGANVYLWFYDSNWNCVGKKDGITTSHNDGAYYVVSDIPGTADKYKVHAYYNGYENIDTTAYNLDMSDRTVVLGSVSNGYYFNLGKYYNVDTLFYYIGVDVDVIPYKLVVADSNNNTIFQQTVTSFAQVITGYCPTQYVRLYIAPYGTASLYDECGTEFNIFGYLGGNLDAKTLSPRKEYKFETPFVYDTVIPSSEAIKCYNLPNTDIHINFYGWPDWTYDEDTSSNYPTITIVNSQIQTSSLNHNWFYRCLAGYNIGANNTVRINLEKNHYNNISDKIITLSARTINGSSQQHTIPYSMTSDTVCYLYMCMNDPNGVGGNIAISPDRVETFTLEREGDAVFTRNEIRDYVSGFSFSYDGCFGQPVSPGRVVDYGGFTFPPLQKTPPSKQYLYEDATNGLPGTVTSSTLAGFQGNFIDLLYNDNFSTVYALPEYVADYTENNNHCYVMEESIIPYSKPVPDYFYFHNNCDIPTDAGIISTYGATSINEMNTSVGIRLEKIGNPGEISLQFSYNGHPWTDYEIGRELLLLKGDKIYFKAKSTNNTFSLDVSNYYKFVVNNNLYSDNENSPTYHQLIEKFCQPTSLNYNTDKIIGNVKYDVIVGGKISSLLSVSTWETSSLNQYGFVNLFFQCGITRCIEPNNSSKYLDVDLLTVPAYGYKNMFVNTFYMINGPKIGATTVGTYAMESMFECSSLKELKDNKLYFTYPNSYCCYRMFADSRYNKTLTIIAANGNVSSCFKEMFHQGKGSNASVRFTNATVFGTDWCRAMFSGSNTSVFCTFDNDIQDIGTTAFYEMYAKSKITSVTFTVTGSVQYRGCMRMCMELSSSYCSIDYMRLNAHELHIECFSHMFYHSTGTNGTFVFDVPDTIPASGCCNMFHKTGTITCNELPALKLSNYCYAWMFCECKISVAPTLPAVQLYDECYRSMFQGSKVKYHYGHEIHTTTLDFGIGSDDIANTNEYVLRATYLPTRCYAYMYAWSKLEAVSNIITEDLVEAGEESCAHMFEGTPITVINRKRWLYDKSRNIKLTFKKENNDCFLARTSFDTDISDWYVRPYLDYTFNGTNQDIKVLTAMTIGGYGGSDYVVKGTKEECTTVNVDGYCGVDGGVYYFDLLTSNNPRLFTRTYYKNTNNHNYHNATEDGRTGLTIGQYPTYSDDESDAIYSQYRSTYEFQHKSEYVYLNATTLGLRCYAYMFTGCYNLVPGHNFKFSDSNHLVTSNTQSFSHMFSGCTQIRTITKDINNIVTAPYCFEYMYGGCYNKLDPNGYSPKLDYCYEGLDYICSNIYTKYYDKDAKETFGGKTYHSYCKSYYHENASDNAHHFNIDGIYVDSKQLQNMNYYNFTKAPSEGSFRGMFKNCRALRYAKIGLNGTPLADFCYQAMFDECVSLYSGVTIPTGITTAPTQCCHAMFQDCLDLVGQINSQHKLSPTTLGQGCYASMYQGCGSLSAGPYLPATTMVAQCYNNMFKSASLFRFDIEIKTTVTIRRSNNTTNTYTCYYGVSGTNMSAATYYYLYGEGFDDCHFYDDAYFTIPSDVDFYVNNIKSVNGLWMFPDVHYFNTHYYNAVNDLISEFDSFLNRNPYMKTDGDTGRTGQIISHTTVENNMGGSGGYEPTISKSLRYIKAQISGPNLVSQNYTYQWLSGLKNNGEYHGPAHNISNSDRNGSTIPTGWTTYSS